MNKIRYSISEASPLWASYLKHLREISETINNTNRNANISNSIDKSILQYKLIRTSIFESGVEYDLAFGKLVKETEKLAKEVSNLRDVGIDRYKNISLPLYESTRMSLYTQIYLASRSECYAQSVYDGIAMEMKSRFMMINHRSDDYSDMIRAFGLECDNRNVSRLLDRVILNILVYLIEFDACFRCCDRRLVKLGLSHDTSFLCKCYDSISATYNPDTVAEVRKESLDSVESDTYDSFAYNRSYEYSDEDELELEAGDQEMVELEEILDPLFNIFLPDENNTLVDCYSSAIEYVQECGGDELFLLDVVDVICGTALEDLISDVMFKTVAIMLNNDVDFIHKLKIAKGLCLIVRCTMFGVC